MAALFRTREGSFAMTTGRVFNTGTVRRSATAVAGLTLVAAIAAAPASAYGVEAPEPSAASTVQNASTAADLTSDLESGSLQIDIAEGFTFKPADGGRASIIAMDGSSVSLATTIDVGSTSYTGTWSTKDGATAVFTVASTSTNSSRNIPDVQPMESGGYAHCVIKTAAAATLAAAITGVFTGPGEVAVIPIGFLAGFAAGHISCLD